MTFESKLNTVRDLANGNDNSDLEHYERKSIRDVLEHYDQMKTALEFYADHANHKNFPVGNCFITKVDADSGSRARKVLEAKETS